MSEATLQSETKVSRRLTTVLAADICGYSHLAEVDDASASKTVELVYAIFEKAVTTHNGRVFNRAGDGFCAEFPNVADGLQAAIDFTRNVKARDTLSPNNPAAKVRAGLHVGDVIDQPDGDLLGHGVNIAARLQGEAEPNGVLVSLHAVNLVRNKTEVHFRRRGPLALKNIDEPVVAFDVAATCKPKSRLALLSNAILVRYRRAFIICGIIAASISAWVLISAYNPQSFDIFANARVAMVISRFGEHPYNESQLNVMGPVLERLSRSHNADDLNLLFLIEKGEFEAAAALLKERTENFPSNIDENEKIDIYEIYGEVLYVTDKAESISVFETIIDKKPEHFLGHARLGRLYYHQSEWTKSNARYESAFAIGAPNNYERLYTEIDYGNSLIIQARFDEGFRVLTKASREAHKHKLDSLISRADTRIAVAHVKVKDFAAARQTINRILPLQKARNFYIDQALCEAILGRIAQSEENYQEAYVHFKASLDIERAQQRLQGIVDTLYDVGMMQLRLGNVTVAEESFTEGLTEARKNSMINMTIKHYIGMAHVHLAHGNKKSSCSTLDRAELLDSPEIVYNPWTISDINRLPCPFPPIGQDAPPT